MIKKCLFPAAGYGTRFLPATKAVPKEMLPILTKPLMQYGVEEALSAGITNMAIVTGRGKRAIEDHFDNAYELESQLSGTSKESYLKDIKEIIKKSTFTYTRQKQMLGLGHAILTGEPLIGDEPFAVLLPDVLVLDKPSRPRNYSFVRLVEAWEATGIGQVMVERVGMDTVENYGIADIASTDLEPFSSVELRALVEKPSLEDARSDLAVLGRYILPAKVLDLLSDTTAGVGGEIQLTDALDMLIKEGGLNAFETDASTYDCGNQQGFLGANLAVGMRDAKSRAYLASLIKSLGI